MAQVKQDEWLTQWEIFNRDEVRFLFQDWIYPTTPESLSGKEVLEGGCGGGVHTEIYAPYASHVTAVDLNTTPLARRRLEKFKHVTILENDIAAMDLKKKFDVVMSIAVVHHTDDPDKTVENLKRHVKPGGKLLLWVYAREGNWMVEYIVEPVRKLLFSRMPRRVLWALSSIITALLYIPVYTVYLLPLKFLPYYQYFVNFRKMSFNRNFLNVFDKLNAPQVQFISQDRVRSWFKDGDFALTHLHHYVGVSWRITAERRV